MGYPKGLTNDMFKWDKKKNKRVLKKNVPQKIKDEYRAFEWGMNYYQGALGFNPRRKPRIKRQNSDLLDDPYIDVINFIYVLKGDITTIKTDAVIIGSTENLSPVGADSNAVFQKAGYSQISDLCKQQKKCETGYAYITPGYNLSNKYIILTVCPLMKDGNQSEIKLLYEAYTNALKLAKANNCRSVAFSLLSVGIYRFPVKQAWNIAIRACIDFLKKNKNYHMNIYFPITDEYLRNEGINCMSEIVKKEYDNIESNRTGIEIHIAYDKNIARATLCHPFIYSIYPEFPPQRK